MMVFGDKGNMSAQGMVMSEKQGMMTNYGRPSEDFTSATSMVAGADKKEPMTNAGSKPSKPSYTNKAKDMNAESMVMNADKDITGWGKK